MGLFDRFSKNKKSKDEEALNSMPEIDKMLFESFLMNEAKFRHQEETVKRSSPHKPITLRYILKDLLDIDPADIGAMTVVDRTGFQKADKETIKIIESKEEVLDFKPYDALMQMTEDGELRPKSGYNSVLIISYRPGSLIFNNMQERKDKSKLGTDNSIIIFLRLIGPFVSETAYMRVSVMIPNFSSPDDFRILRSNNAPFTTSFVLGFDITPPKERLKQFEEIEASLNRKLTNSENLSDSEAAILEGITHSRGCGYNIGYGKWLVSENRFADALIFLLNAFQALKKEVVTNFEQYNEAFTDICFNIGFCYTEMEQYDRAVYYLGLIQGSGNLAHTTEYINALVNGGDPRAISVVEACISEFEEGKREVNSEEDSMFFEFLCRRLAYLYIEYRMLDAATHLLKQMKEMPGCRDFAIDELNYIEMLKSQN